MNKPQILGFLRHFLTFAGGAIGTQGVASDSDIAEVIGAIMTIVGFTWSVVEKRRQRPAAPAPASGSQPPFASLVLPFLLLSFALLSQMGCARFRTVQRDISTDTNGVSRTIETTATASTFAAGKQALAAWKAGQTDKSQTASVGSVNQESDAAGLMQGLIAMGRMAAAMQGIPLPAVAPAAESSAARAGPPTSTAVSIPLQISVVPQVNTPAPAARPSSR